MITLKSVLTDAQLYDLRELRTGNETDAAIVEKAVREAFPAVDKVTYDADTMTLEIECNEAALLEQLLDTGVDYLSNAPLGIVVG